MEWTLIYSNDLSRIDDRGDLFGYKDGGNYRLSLDIARDRAAIPNGDTLFVLKIFSVCRHITEDGNQDFAARKLVERAVRFSDWLQGGRTCITVPFTYRSAAPNGALYGDDDHLLHWEIEFIHASGQEFTLYNVFTWALPPLDYDMNGDGWVDKEDLMILVGYFRRTEPLARTDWLMPFARAWSPPGGRPSGAAENDSGKSER